MQMMSLSQLWHHEGVPKQHVGWQQVLVLSSGRVVDIYRLQDFPFVGQSRLTADTHQCHGKVCCLKEETWQGSYTDVCQYL